MKNYGGWQILCLVFDVVIFACTIIIIVSFCNINADHKELLANIKDIKQQLSVGDTTILMEISNDMNQEYLFDQLSVIFGIIAAGVGLFSIFGVVLSFLNVHETEKSEKTRNSLEEKMNRISADQEELKNRQSEIKKSQEEIAEQQRIMNLSRLLQEGRVFAQRGRPRYAEENFREILRSEQLDSLSKFTARFELFSLYADNFPIDSQSLKEIDKERSERAEPSFIDYLEFEGEKFEKMLDAEGKSHEIQILKADLYFTLGCLYGNYILYLSTSATGDRDKNYIAKYAKKENEYFRKAVKNDEENVEYLIHRAVSYATAGNIEKCKKDLDMAKDKALQYPIYMHLVMPDRLSKVFCVMRKRIPNKIQKQLSANYKIKFK